MKLSLVLCALIGSSQAATWDYKDNGKTWTTSSLDDCATKTQSPINLLTENHEDFDAEKTPIIDSAMDMLTTSYSNLVKTKVTATYTVQANMAEPNIQYFDSVIASKEYGAQQRYFAKQFHFHAGSEHTIDGERMSFEMHVVHYPNKENQPTEAEKVKSIAGVIGILFDETKGAKISKSQESVIDTFFDSVDMGNKDPTVDLIAFKSLMEMVDLENRWTYKGSLTTPPCSTNLYWNVVRTVYPIKAKHVKQFKALLDQQAGYDDKKLGAIGNYRVVQEVDNHDVKYIKKEEMSDSETGLIVGIVILAVFALVLFACVCMYMKKYNAAVKAASEGEKKDSAVANEIN